MGVPLRRSSAAQAVAEARLAPDVLSATWLEVFRCCSVHDLGRCLAVSKTWNLVADSHHVWKDTYERTQRADATSEPGDEDFLRALIDRPFGDDAVGWQVEVLTEEGIERYAKGVILAYSPETDAYLVGYDGKDGVVPAGEAWEQERRKRTNAMRHNPSLAGKSRFSFLTPPAQAWPRRYGSGEMKNQGGRAQMRFPTWKQELENNVNKAPKRLLCRLTEHTDEVLYVVFSPCGTRLASCSRDLRTVIFRVRYGTRAGDSCSDGAAPSSSSSTSPSGCHRNRRWAEPTFEPEAVFVHRTAPCRATWWPVSPHNMLAVSTEDAGWHSDSKVEIWEILTRDGDDDVEMADAMAADAAMGGSISDEDIETLADDPEPLPVGTNARCIFRGQNRPFDIYAPFFSWPTTDEDSHSRTQDPSKLCFLSGWAVFREHEHYVQWLNVWPGPRHPAFRPGHETGDGQSQALVPLARLRLEGDMNYLHCLEVGPGAQSRRILTMTGSTPHLCDEIGIIDLARVWRLEDGQQDMPTYGAPVEAQPLGQRVVLSAKWSQRGDFLILNTRPYAHSSRFSTASSSSRSRSEGRGSHNASFEDLLLRPAPDLSTSMELLMLDSCTLDTVGFFDGHFAFTTKESPFLIFTDEWGDADFVASGGEDHRVYIWHRRHRRLLRRLCGHTEPVNAVSWNGAGLLASGSDDHSIIIWATGRAGHSAELADSFVASSASEGVPFLS
mmetsp:Transcript_63307/g.151008  ORF Transcript_63307/g.151008 Transcript_63307/m.151008 type:complete len:724 (+) Transcript_63307:122-2293(+)